MRNWENLICEKLNCKSKKPNANWEKIYQGNIHLYIQAVKTVTGKLEKLFGKS